MECTVYGVQALQAVQAMQAVQPGEGARRGALDPRRARESLQEEAVCSRGKSSATSCHLDFNIIISSCDDGMVMMMNMMTMMMA